MIFLKVFQQLNILVLILADKELKNMDVDCTFVEGGTKMKAQQSMGGESRVRG